MYFYEVQLTSKPGMPDRTSLSLLDLSRIAIRKEAIERVWKEEAGLKSDLMNVLSVIFKLTNRVVTASLYCLRLPICARSNISHR